MDVAGKKIHFLGIGGIGMSAIAQIALERGAVVTGCDLKKNKNIVSLSQRGAQVHLGHHASHVDGHDLVVYSAAVPPENPEVDHARQLGIPIISRAMMLARLMESKKCIAIAGAHGKTTTTWIVSKMLIDAGLDPTVMIGGNVQALLGNFREGKGEWFVTEVDESNGLINEIRPTYSIITNIDREHLDHYSGIEDIKNAFANYANNTVKGGAVIGCHDDANVNEVFTRTSPDKITYGMQNGSDLKALNVRLNKDGSDFVVRQLGQELGEVHLGIPGEHNVRNALACIALGLKLGISFDVIRDSLIGVRNVERRFNIRGNAGGVTVIDDYGHHPTEIRATLATARLTTEGKVIVVFQPHRYSRTKLLIDDFAVCFKDADYLVVTDIYTANEKPIEGVSGALIYDRVRAQTKTPVEFIRKRETIVDHIVEVAKPKDTVILLGAGDIYELADEIIKRLQ